MFSQWLTRKLPSPLKTSLWNSTNQFFRFGLCVNNLLTSILLHSQWVTGQGVNDSPIGLAAYILEKFSTWTKPEWRSLPDGGLTKAYTLDDLLTNVMIYWVNGNIASSMRLYKEEIGGNSRDYHTK